MSRVCAFAKVGKRFERSPREIRRLHSVIARLDDQTLLSPFPASSDPANRSDYSPPTRSPAATRENYLRKGSHFLCATCATALRRRDLRAAQE